MNLMLIIGIGIKLSLFLAVLSYGMQSTLDDVLYLFRRPGQLARALVSMFVVMAVFVAVLVAFFDLNPVIEIALIALAVSPVPPILPNKALKSGGSKSFTFGLLVAVSLLSVIVVPLALKFFGAVFGRQADLSEISVGITILTSVVLPLVIGMLIRHFAPDFSERFAAPLGKIAMLILILACLPILIALFPLMWSLIGNGTILAIIAFVLVGITAGHFLGGPDPDDRTVLALATTSRHPAIAIALASAGVAENETKLAVAAVFLYILVSGIVAAPYLAWLRNDTGKETAVNGARAAKNFRRGKPLGEQITGKKFKG